MSARLVAATVLALVLTACTRWSMRPVPLDQAFTTDSARDIAVRLRDDSTHWWRVRQARLVGDSIVGQSKATGRLRRVTVPVDNVLELVVREPDRVGNGALIQLAEMASFLGIVLFIGTAFPLFTPKGWAL